MVTCCHDISSRFSLMTDEEIVVYARAGHSTAVEHLMTKYRHLVESKARTYFLLGADNEDVVQEGMIGLYKAIRDYRTDRLSRFRAFADLCVTRQIITAVKSATRQKHSMLNGSVSLDGQSADPESDGCLIDHIPDETAMDPQDWVTTVRARRQFYDAVHENLSVLESAVLEYYLDGLSYREMSVALSCRTKSIDNALQRVKRKIAMLQASPEGAALC
ncbi:MAG: RNA polymerase sporulation sigma factor SigH [Armatimonadetes bacterium]|nr:RNA polymerase sporulation sigma factor SigH [Armatimonadota bacterium]